MGVERSSKLLFSAETDNDSDKDVSPNGEVEVDDDFPPERPELQLQSVDPRKGWNFRGVHRVLELYRKYNSGFFAGLNAIFSNDRNEIIGLIMAGACFCHFCFKIIRLVLTVYTSWYHAAHFTNPFLDGEFWGGYSLRLIRKIIFYLTSNVMTISIRNFLFFL